MKYKIPDVRNRIAMQAWNRGGAGIHKDGIDRQRYICRERIKASDEELEDAKVITENVKIAYIENNKHYILDFSSNFTVGYDLLEEAEWFMHTQSLDHLNWEVYVFRNSKWLRINLGELTDQELILNVKE